MTKQHYLWLDLETTGLDEREHAILEIAFAVTDDEGRTVDLTPHVDVISCFSIISYDRGQIASTVLTMPDVQLCKLAPAVVKMHAESGLLEACANLKGLICSRYITTQIYRLVNTLKLDTKPILAGNSIHFDWRFLREHMPEIVSLLHYRMLDMSAVALFADGLGIPRPEKRNTHRAAEDIAESLNLFKYYREELCARWQKV